MAQKVCRECLDLPYEQRCQECHKKHIFYNLGEYCEWALRQKNTIQIAHKLKAYEDKSNFGSMDQKAQSAQFYFLNSNFNQK